MSKRTRNASLAKETLQILDQGFYINTQNQKVSITQLQKQAEDNSIHYRPELFEAVFAKRNSIAEKSKTPTLFEVVNETTLDATKQLKDSGYDKVLALNFASAKNPGGGFQSGAQAQEESLARSSGLYPCLVKHWDMYEINRGNPSCLYSDHMIYSPDVPVFRNDHGHLLDAPYTLSFLTAPAVNAGVVIQRTNVADQQAIPATMLARTEKVVSVAMVHGYKVLVLGAWGCGVFRNNPADVAAYFRHHLVENPVFQNAFEKVVFAVWDRSEKQATYQAFVKAFGLP
jgi:uncharacterized protein (TIGR02452 family)